jgi:hypothetical protein
MRLQLQQNEAHAAAEAAATNQANELTRLQLQLQLAQQTAATGTAHILQMAQSLSVLKDLGLSLSSEQAEKKRKMEYDLAEKCLAVANAPPDPLVAISAQLNILSPAYASTAPRLNAPPQQRAAAGGGVSNNLHPQFNAAR